MQLCNKRIKNIYIFLYKLIKKGKAWCVGGKVNITILHIKFS